MASMARAVHSLGALTPSCADCVSRTAPRPAFARGKVCHVGDIVAAVVAETKTQAGDAADQASTALAAQETGDDRTADIDEG